MNHHYAPGFNPSSRKKQKKQSSVPIGTDIIGSRNYTEFVVMKMKESKEHTANESEDPTQIADLSALSSENSKSESQDKPKLDPNLFAFYSKPEPTEKETCFSKLKPTKGDWMTKRSVSSSLSIQPGLATDKIWERKSVEDELPLSLELVKKGTSPVAAADLEWFNTERSLDRTEASDDETSKSSKQTTLTQYVRSLDTPVKKRESVQTTLSQFVTPLKTPSEKKKSLKSLNIFASRTPGYGVEWRDAMPGDLVMAFASDIDHPAIEEGLIHRNYILLGIVKSFVHVEWNTEMGDDEWDGITTQERLKMFWADIPGWDDDTCNQPKHPHNSQVKVIALKRDGDLEGINPEFKALIDDQFEFVRGGWAFKQYFP